MKDLGNIFKKYYNLLIVFRYLKCISIRHIKLINYIKFNIIDGWMIER